MSRSFKNIKVSEGFGQSAVVGERVPQVGDVTNYGTILSLKNSYISTVSGVQKDYFNFLLAMDVGVASGLGWPTGIAFTTYAHAATPQAIGSGMVYAGPNSAVQVFSRPLPGETAFE